MIGKDDLLRIARLSGMRPYQQEKHYIQTIILRSIFSGYGNRLVFKGGTALWFFHGLRRFSEDLDFTATADIDPNPILNHVKGDLEALGVESSAKLLEAKQSVSFRLGAKGPLFEGGISTCFVRVEVSLREKVLLRPTGTELNPPYPDIGPFSTLMMNLEEIAAEKVRAIMTREKARDVHDLLFLFRKGQLPSIKLVNEKLGYYNRKFDYEDFAKSVIGKKKVWKSELANLIFGDFPSFEETSRELLEAVKNLPEG